MKNGIDRRRHWTSARRAAHSQATKAFWARKRSDNPRLAARRVERPFTDIFEECLNALRVRQLQFENVHRAVTALDDRENFENCAGHAAQHAMQLDMARQALTAVVRFHREMVAE